MIKSILQTKRLWASLLSILLGLYLIQQNQLNLSEFQYAQNKGPLKKFEGLPHYGTSIPKTDIYYRFNLNYTWPGTTQLRIIPDDCLHQVKIGDAVISPDKIKGRTCDFNQGVQVDLGDVLEVGPNSFSIHIKNNGGKFGLRIEPLNSPFTPFGYALIVIPLLLLLWAICKKLKIASSIRIVLIIGILLRVFYFQNTPALSRAYDVDGHIKYIDFIALENKIPGNEECWQCYHPIGYYSLVGVYAKSFLNLTTLDKDSIYQSFTLLLDAVFLIFGILFFRNFLTPNYLFLASLLLVFWPSGIIHAGRIGNDHLVYLLYAATLYFISKYNGVHKRPIILATIMVCLSLFVKTNGIVAAFPLIAYYFIRTVFVDQRGFKKGFLGSSGILLAVLMTLFINMAPAAYEVYQGKKDQLLVGNASALHGGLKIQNKVSNFLIIDTKGYFEQTYTSPWNDRGGRQYFWNYHFTTALFGEFTHSKSSEKWAFILKLLFGFSLLTMSVGFFHPSTLKTSGPGLYILSGVGLIIAAILFRIKLPYACANDFRYVYPLILTWIPLTLAGLKKMSQYSGWVQILPLAFVASWLISSLSFIFSLL